MRGRKSKNPEDVEADEEKIEETYRGRKIVCTCNEDPNYCEKHSTFA